MIELGQSTSDQACDCLECYMVATLTVDMIGERKVA